MSKYIGWAILLGSLAAILYLRFTNIDMSETRLFVTYWKEFAVISISVVIGYFIALRGIEKGSS
jgi:nucleoside permease NupC